MTGQRALVAGFVVWTLFVWTTRIGNILGDDDLSSGDRSVRLATAIVFTALALAVAWFWIRRGPPLALAVGVLGAFTVVVWLVRGTTIVFGDRGAGFKVVHSVLALVSIGLAALTWPRRPASG